MKLMHANVLAIQSYGYIRGRDDMDSGAVGSRARILYAAMLVDAGIIPRENLIAVFPQGYGVGKPDEPKDRPHLGKMMERYLKSRPELFGIETNCYPLSWGTFADIQNTYRLTKEMGFEVAHVHFVTDPVHLKRVRLVWEKTHPEGWSASFYGAVFHRMTWYERWIREPAARLAYWWKLRSYER